MRKVDPRFDREIEKSIVFLVNKMEESGNNPKPVILHSTRVGVYLYEQGCEKHIIVAGFLHDLVEDSDTSIQEIENAFGNKVAGLVAVNTDDESIDDRLEQAKEAISRCREFGIEALTIKAADMLDNSYYYKRAKDKEEFDYLIDKMKYYLETSKEVLGDTKTWKELSAKHQRLKKFSFRG